MSTDHDQTFENQEDIAKAAILEKVMKGRQPTDLMLRCECALSRPNFTLGFMSSSGIGTILDAEGASKIPRGRIY